MTEQKELFSNNSEFDKFLLRIFGLVILTSGIFVGINFFWNDRWSASAIFILIIAIVFYLILKGSINVASDTKEKFEKHSDQV